MVRQTSRGGINSAHKAEPRRAQEETQRVSRHHRATGHHRVRHRPQAGRKADRKAGPVMVARPPRGSRVKRATRVAGAGAPDAATPRRPGGGRRRRRRLPRRGPDAASWAPVRERPGAGRARTRVETGASLLGRTQAWPGPPRPGGGGGSRRQADSWRAAGGEAKEAVRRGCEAAAAERRRCSAPPSSCT